MPVPYLLALVVLALGMWTDDPMVINIVVILVAIGTLQLALDVHRRRD
ncbi:hypothetical protein [Nocardioides sp.]|nr:hypothetical protein [Nocardioides sp.]